MSKESQLEERARAERINSWGYRVVRYSSTVNDEEDESFAVIEAYYNKDGLIVAWCEAVPTGNTVHELYNTLTRMDTATGQAFLTNPMFAPIDVADLPHMEEEE